MKNKKNKTSKDGLTAGDKLGIKGLNKSKRRKLEAYQHLFYLLQVIETEIQHVFYPSEAADTDTEAAFLSLHLSLDQPALPG